MLINVVKLHFLIHPVFFSVSQKVSPGIAKKVVSVIPLSVSRSDSEELETLPSIRGWKSTCLDFLLGKSECSRDKV